MEGKIRLKAIQRIYKDLNEIEESPIEGLSIAMPDEDNPFELRANILILDGIYKDILLHMIVNLPENYPLKAPKMSIAPGQSFNHNFHHHVFGTTICIDLLDHGFFGEGQKTGWTPAYTLSSVLMQMQIFFAKDHDLHQLPSKADIQKLKESSKNFTTFFKLTNGKEVTHSYEKPYPPLKNKGAPKPKQEDDKEVIRRKKAYERLTCYLTRNTPNESEFPMGYPMRLSRDDKDRIQIVPVMEILSYEGYVTQLASEPWKVFDSKNFGKYHLRTAMGAEYNYWFPLYINEETYQKNKQYILNAISVLKYGIEGVKKHDFTPELILSIFPCLMNKMIVALQDGALFQSYAAIEAYCHFMRLFARLLQEFPHLQESIDKKAELVLMDNKARNKTNLGDMGEFLITLAFSKIPFKSKELWKELIKEYISRQFLWVILKVDARAKGKGVNDIFVKETKEIQFNNMLFFYQMTGHEMKEFYRASKISNNLLLFNFTAVTRFLLDKELFIKKIDNNYGVIEEPAVEDFLKEIKKIKSSINNYPDLFKSIGLEEFYNDYSSVLGLFRVALKNSYIQGYNSFKLSKLSSNFIQKGDYLSLLVRWFIEGSPENKKLIDFLIKPKQTPLLIDLASRDMKDIFGEDFPFPQEFSESFKNRRGFEVEVVSRKFFYLWLILVSKNIKIVPQKMLIEMFTLSPKEEKSVQNNDKIVVKVFKHEENENKIEITEKKSEIFEKFTNAHIENIIKSFSIVLNMTLNRLFEKFKVLTFQTLCFLIRVFLLAKENIPELNDAFEAMIKKIFARKGDINYGSLINLAIFVGLTTAKNYEDRIQLILKHALSRNIAKLIKREQQRQDKRRNIIEILAFLFKEQFEISKNEEFQKVLFIQNIFSIVFQNYDSFIENMDTHYFIMTDEKIEEIRNFHKKVKGGCDRIEKLPSFFKENVNTEDFLFSALEISIGKSRFFTDINENLEILLENPKSCLFFAKIFWKTEIFEDLNVKGFEKGLVKHLIEIFTKSLFKIFSGFYKKKEEREIEIGTISEIYIMVKKNIEKFQKSYMNFCGKFLNEECVDSCSEEDFYKILIISEFLQKKKFLLNCFGKEIFRKYLRFIIAKIWEEKVIENSQNIPRFFDYYWLKQTIYNYDSDYKRKNRFLIFLIGMDSSFSGGFGEMIDLFHQNEKGMFLSHLYEHLTEDKKSKNQSIETMTKEIQEEIKEKFKDVINL